MRITLLLLGFCSTFLLMGCFHTTNTDAPDNFTDTQTGDIISTGNLFTGRTLSNNDYQIDTVSEIPQTYSGSQFEIKKITHISTGRWVYIIYYNGSRAEFYTDRSHNIYDDGETHTGNLADEAFSSIGTGNHIRSRVQVPVDRVLLIKEANGITLAIDADDPSGMQNKMNEEDLEQLVQYIDQE